MFRNKDPMEYSGDKWNEDLANSSYENETKSLRNLMSLFYI